MALAPSLRVHTLFLDAARRGVAVLTRGPAALVQRIPGEVSRRLGWGVADQAMSSLTNFVVVLYVARTLGAVQFGAFSLAYVTYSFALAASRGLATDPLMVRFSGTGRRAWRRAVSGSSGTAAVVGTIAGCCVLAAAAALHGPSRLAFLGLGLTLPGLMVQDSWRYAFFALGRGGHAFLNDTIWAVTLVPALLVLRAAHHRDVFWFIFVWGASACVGALAGPLQSGVIPRLSGARRWVTQHSDLGPRYLAENTSQSGSNQLRTYVFGLVLGLAAIGYVQAATTLMGPFMVIYLGMSLVAVPEAARIVRRSPRRLLLFCAVTGGGLAVAGLGWGLVLLVALPRGLGDLLLGSIWRPAYPLLVPLTVSVMGQCLASGAGTGLHALGAARRSLSAMLVTSAAYLVFGIAGAFADGTMGIMVGTAAATWIGAVVWWWQLRLAMRAAAFGGVPATAPRSSIGALRRVGYAQHRRPRR